MENENLDSLFEDAVTKEETPAAEENQTAETTPAAPAAEEPKPELSVQERARQAEGRRIRQREEQAYRAAYQQARADVSALLKRVGLKDGDRDIDTVDALEAYERSMSDERIASGRGTAQDLERVVQSAIMKMQPPPPQRTEAVDSAEVQRQLAQIRAMDPAMTDLGAILRSEAGEKFRGYVDKGLDFVDAYTLAAKDRLAGLQSNRAAAKSGGKQHLNATKQQGTGALSVPRDELDLFRALNPGASDADIQKFYNADKKKFG
jgi:hypothetical protein